MFVPHGVYCFRPKIVAYRNDFCFACATLVRAYQARTFDVIHIFYVPLIPLGFWRRWHCGNCKNDPHTYPHTRRVFKWAGAIAVGVFAAAAWFEPAEGDRFVWALRVGLPVAFLALLWNTLKSKPDPRFNARLREVMPADESICPLCSSPLIVGDRSCCSGCGIERKVLAA